MTASLNKNVYKTKLITFKTNNVYNVQKIVNLVQQEVHAQVVQFQIICTMGRVFRVVLKITKLRIILVYNFNLHC